MGAGFLATLAAFNASTNNLFLVCPRSLVRSEIMIVCGGFDGLRATLIHPIHEIPYICRMAGGHICMRSYGLRLALLV